MKRLFEPGRIIVSRGVQRLVVDRSGLDPLALLRRHLAGDWGEVSEEEWRRNNARIAGARGDAIASKYNIGGRNEVWVTTSADRAQTRLKTPADI